MNAKKIALYTTLGFSVYMAASIPTFNYILKKSKLTDEQFIELIDTYGYLKANVIMIHLALGLKNE